MEVASDACGPPEAGEADRASALAESVREELLHAGNWGACLSLKFACAHFCLERAFYLSFLWCAGAVPSGLQLQRSWELFCLSCVAIM